MLESFRDDDSSSAPSRRRALATMAIISVVAGLLVSVPAIPVVFATKDAARSVSSLWTSMDATLPIEPAPQRSEAARLAGDRR